MDESLELKLCEKYPFYTIHGDEGTNYYCAFDCGSGWNTLLEDMSQDIRNIIESKYDGNLDFTISYIKEKYAQLDIFTFGCPDDIQYIIDQAEYDSKHICENCGLPGELHLLGSWMYTRCDKCWDIIIEINRHNYD